MICRYSMCEQRAVLAGHWTHWSSSSECIWTFSASVLVSVLSAVCASITGLRPVCTLCWPGSCAFSHMLHPDGPVQTSGREEECRASALPRTITISVSGHNNGLDPENTALKIETAPTLDVRTNPFYLPVVTMLLPEWCIHLQSCGFTFIWSTYWHLHYYTRVYHWVTSI